ncbi:uncharacterized protein LOC110106616 [Dendrobium catenatum]|uniref:Uncharacterized protein n=1 Tax=Dendrobium catenatum TaxID=906689 RepID=A0A2I0VE45_9ASPA|nr:uncharacterized protein LOC110106616 [Dendrobium catenatum]PKU61685.1 hypothetical protein MA16_Dca028076 [Dendrobium catenatum]
MGKLDAVDENQDLELLKAVAQAWHAHAGDANPTNEFDARRAACPHIRRPSRFKLEAAAAAAREVSSWDFSRSLWDSYELITIAKQLEACNLGLDQPMPSPPVSAGGQLPGKRRRESKNSLRSLFSKTSSRRFDERDIPGNQ